MKRISRSMWVAWLMAALLIASVPGLPVAAQTSQTPQTLCAAATANLSEPATRQFAQAEQVLQPDVDYWAVLCTDAGPIYLDLYEDAAPQTVNNFVFLAQQGFYNNTTFHRVLPGFMAQGGDPTGTGTGGPGYTFADETDNGLVFDTYGLLAMANAGPDTNGSQFFITTVPTPWLDGNHTIFGKVYEGIERVELLTPRDPEQMPDYEGAALQTVVIVDDPDSVQATPDGPPAIEHIQDVLALTMPLTLNELFVLDGALSHVYDAAAEAAYWESQGAGLGAALETYLAERGFEGAATVYFALEECPQSTAELPIWEIGLRVLAFGDQETAQAIVFDDERAALLEGAGAFDAHSNPEDIGGRIFSRALAEGCGEQSTAYRLEFPYGRYIVVAELTMDDAIIGPQTDPSSTQFLAYVLQDLLFGTVGGTLDRGNAAVTE